MRDLVTDVKSLELETLKNLKSSKALNTLRAYKADYKDFASADLIRERLQKIGIEFKDLPEGTTWEVTDNN